jgi:DNA repair exonuclease SbcCD ATPase subunit
VGGGVEVLLFLTVVILVGGLVGGGVLLRDFGQRVLERDTRTTVEAVQARAEADADRLRSELRSLAGEYQAQLGRLRERNSELENVAARYQEQADLARAAQREATELRRELTDLRSELDARLSAFENAIAGGEGPRSARVAALADLYGRLARVETSLSALTNPILLPGEPYVVPDDLVPDAMKWDNWKEVGESAYALGEQFNQMRIQLPRQTVEEIERCVTTLRTTLTASIYPNLDASLSPEQAKTLRSGLTAIAEALTRLRERLEADYRALTGIRDEAI